MKYGVPMDKISVGIIPYYYVRIDLNINPFDTSI